MKRWIGCLAVMAALMVFLAHIPLSWVGNKAMPKSAPIQPIFLGTIWKGVITNIPQIGPLKTAVKPLSILENKPPIWFSSEAPYLKFSGIVSLGGLLGLNIDGDIRGLSSIDKRFFGVEGNYTLKAKKIKFRDVCESGEGTVRTDILSRNLALWQWQGPDLSGPITCENGDIVLSLKGADTLQDINAIIRIDLGGVYRAEITVVSQDPRASMILPLFGFQEDGLSYRLNEAGRWF